MIPESFDINATIAEVTGALTEKPIVITIHFDDGKQKKEFTIKPIKVGNMYRIAGMIRLIPDSIISPNAPLRTITEGIFEHIDKMIYIVAVGLQNNGEEPTEYLIKLIRDEFTMMDIMTVYDAVMVNLNLKDFINSIILIKGADILKSDVTKMSPKRTGEIIAPGV